MNDTCFFFFPEHTFLGEGYIVVAVEDYDQNRFLGNLLFGILSSNKYYYMLGAILDIRAISVIK